MKLEKEGLVVTPLTEQKTGLWDRHSLVLCQCRRPPSDDRRLAGRSWASAK